MINYALLAQLVEQLPLKEMVVGSTPTRGTKARIKKDWTAPVFFAFVRQSHIFSVEKIDESGSWNFFFDERKNIPDQLN